MAITGANISQLPSIFGLPAGSTVALSGTSEAIGLSFSSLANFEGDSDDPFIVLSSGIASQVTNANTSGAQGTDLGAFGTPGDRITLTFTIPKPDNAKAFTFDFTFLTEEFPEYVGSQFNDYLSVRLNGVEIAVDLSGNPVTVNNNFFSSTLSPSGTFFDGQTPPLRITAPVSGSDPTISLVIEISDVGDGIYDSAAFLRSFAFLEAQIVYLQFQTGFLSFSSFASNSAGFTLPGSGLSAAQQDLIISKLNAVYAGFLIEFTTVKPTSGDYSTIHVGGTVGNLPAYLEAPAGLLGQAEKIDFGNGDKSDDAFVLAGEIGSNLDLIAQVIAHEAGHILGLRHVDGEAELMYPYAGSNRITLGGERPLAEIEDNIVTQIGGTQDTREELERNLGLESSAQLIVSEGFFDKLKKFFNFSLDSTASHLFDVKAVVATSENEVISVFDLGDISGSQSVEFWVPATDKDKVVLIGKSSAGGGYDTFMSPGGLTNFSAASSSQGAILEMLGIDISDIGTGSLGIVQADAAGNLTSVGALSPTVVDVADVGASEGADVLRGTEAANAIPGLGGDDTISGFKGNDQLFGNDGDDTLNGGLGADVMRGAAGDDIYVVDNAADRVVETHASDSLDTVRSSVTFTLPALVENLTLTGSEKINATGNALANVLVGNAAANVLSGGSGQDQLSGGGGKDTLNGGVGNDLLNGGVGADVMNGGAGNDSYKVDNAGDQAVESGAGGGVDLVESSVSFTLGGFVENLRLTGTGAIGGTGNALANQITGNGAANTLRGGAGADTMTGWAGNDTYFVDHVGDKVIEPKSTGGTDTVNSSVSFALGANVENLTLTGTSALQGTGNALANLLIGNGSANVLRGGAGADTLKGGGGTDTLYGGEGNDRYFVNSVGDRVVESSAAGGADTVNSTVSCTLGANVENLTLTGTSALAGTGNALANILTGNAAANVLRGGAGADTLKGGGGADTAHGGEGNDSYFVNDVGDRAIESRATGGTDTVSSSVTFALGAHVENLTLTGTASDGTGNALANLVLGNAAANVLRGGAGADTLKGGDGNDRLFGGEGHDSLRGGDGADRFMFDKPLGPTNVDHVLDFVRGADKIVLDNAVFKGLAAGPLAAGAFVVGTAAADAGDRIIYNPATGALLYDPDGTGAAAAIRFAFLDTLPATLAASDFQVI